MKTACEMVVATFTMGGKLDDLSPELLEHAATCEICGSVIDAVIEAASDRPMTSEEREVAEGANRGIDKFLDWIKKP